MLRDEDRLVRQLAQELTVNQNTVLRVYERLAADGLLEMKHGEGTFVAGNASRRRFEKQRRQFVDELGLVIRRGVMLGMSPDEMRRFRWRHVSIVFQSAMNALNPVLCVGDQFVDMIRAHEHVGKSAARDRAARSFGKFCVGGYRLLRQAL